MGFLQIPEAVPEQGVVRSIAFGIVVDDFLCFCARQLYQLTVSGNIRYLQVESHAALLRSLQVAGTTEFQVGLGDTETVVRIAHDINTFAGFFRELIVGYQNAVALVAASSYTASQLVQLGQTEALCIQDNHH